MAQKIGLYAFGYNSAKIEQIGRNLEQCEPNVGIWPWQILGAYPCSSDSL